MKLQDYRKLLGVSRLYVANKLGVDQSAVWRWEKGAAIPMSRQIMAITRWSDGAVTANDFISPKAQNVSQA